MSNNAREYTSASARLRLASARVLGVEPWSGPRRGATLVRVRARGAAAVARGVRGASAATRWRRRGASSASASGGGSSGSVARRRRVARRVRGRRRRRRRGGWACAWSARTAARAVSSGGGFYYHRRVRVRGRGAAARAVARRHARGGGGRRLPRRVHAALPFRQRVERGARAVRRRVAARVRVAGARGRREGGGRVDERAAVRAGGVVGCGGVVHVPAVGGGELGRAGARARGGRRAADGARARLLVGVGGARAAAVPRGRRVASRARGGARARSRASRRARGGGGDGRGEQQRARVHVGAARLRLVSARVLGVEPWSGPRRGATLVRVRARGSLPSRAACRFGGDAVAARRRSRVSVGVGWSVSVARRRRVARRVRVGAVGVDGVGGRARGRLVRRRGVERRRVLLPPARRARVRGAAPPLGPSRGGTRVAVVGGGFRDAYTLRCRLENASRAVLARYVDESQLECASPVHSVGAKAVGVSMNAQQYAPAASSAAAASFTYQPSAAVSWVAPARALAEGGAPLTVRGRGFSSASEALARLLCRVGGASRRAAWGSDALGRVRRAAGAGVGGDGRGEQQRARVHVGVGAAAARVGARARRRAVERAASGRDARARACARAARCRRARRAASAATRWRRRSRRRRRRRVVGLRRASAARRASCARRRRRRRRGGWACARVGSYGGAVSSGGGFYYHRRVRVRGAAPPLGSPSRGGTRVAVVGGGFRDAYTLRCRLENASRAVLARYVDESQLECASPVHSVGAKAVGVSMNAQQYAPAASSAAAASFTYQPSAAVSWVAPARALAEGGAPLTVRGRGFSSASEALARLLCRVGGASRRAAWGATARSRASRRGRGRRRRRSR